MRLLLYPQHIFRKLIYNILTTFEKCKNNIWYMFELFRQYYFNISNFLIRFSKQFNILNRSTHWYHDNHLEIFWRFDRPYFHLKLILNKINCLTWALVFYKKEGPFRIMSFFHVYLIPAYSEELIHVTCWKE